VWARALVASSIVAAATTARADSIQVAQETFERGRQLMAEKKFAEACAAFEQSQRLDPEFGTLYNLATCDEEIGKLATAWNLYREVARGDQNKTRRQVASDLAAKLAPRVPKLVVDVPSAPAGLVVTIDGTDSSRLVGIEVRVDLGDHVVVATAPGFRERRETVRTAREGTTDKLSLALERAEVAPPVASPAPRPAPPTTPVVIAPPTVRAAADPAGNDRVLAGKVVVVGGGVVVAGGLVVGALALSAYHDAQSCMACDRPSDSHHAVVLGNVSTITVVVGLATVVGGIYLWRSGGGSAVVAPQPGGVAIAGTF
jgi:hypothetical protein